MSNMIAFSDVIIQSTKQEEERGTHNGDSLTCPTARTTVTSNPEDSSDLIKRLVQKGESYPYIYLDIFFRPMCDISHEEMITTWLYQLLKEEPTKERRIAIETLCELSSKELIFMGEFNMWYHLVPLIEKYGEHDVRIPLKALMVMYFPKRDRYLERYQERLSDLVNDFREIYQIFENQNDFPKMKIFFQHFQGFFFDLERLYINRTPVRELRNIIKIYYAVDQKHRTDLFIAFLFDQAIHFFKTKIKATPYYEHIWRRFISRDIVCDYRYLYEFYYEKCLRISKILFDHLEEVLQESLSYEEFSKRYVKGKVGHIQV